MKAVVRELLERALELARAGVRVYEAALGCAVRRARAWARSLWLAALGRPAAVPARRKRPRRARAVVEGSATRA